MARRPLAAAVSAALMITLVAGTASAQLIEKKALSLAEAKRIAAGAEAAATKDKLTDCIAIVDDGGYVVYLETIDETQRGSIATAIAKARSAVLYKRPTKVFEDAVAKGRTALLRLPGALPIEGGIPLMAEGKVIGAIGVSGGTAAQDGQIAQAGASQMK